MRTKNQERGCMNMNEYSNMPAFQSIIKQFGIIGAKGIITDIQNIRYMIYITSYMMNNCQKITGTDNGYDAKCTEYLTDILKQENNLGVAVKLLHSAVKTDMDESIYEHHSTFYGIYPKYKTIDVLSLPIVICDNKLSTWKLISNMPYNKIKNPAAITDILDKIFKHDNSKQARNTVKIYDLGDYEVIFTDAVEMKRFIKSFVSDCDTFQIYGNKQINISFF